MPIKSLYRGASFEICCWQDEKAQSPLEGFFQDLVQSGHPDLCTMLNLLKRTAEVGPPKNIEMTRMLEGKKAEGLLEFKAGAIRVIWFYEAGKIIICTHGFLKKGRKTPPGEIERAQEIRSRYDAEQERNPACKEPSVRHPVRRSRKTR